MGITIRGIFIESANFTNENGSVTFCLYVACGRSSYGVYMDKDFRIENLSGIAIGDTIEIQARPYVDKNSHLRWGGGVLVSNG